MTGAPPTPGGARLPGLAWLGLAASFVATALAIAWPAIDGEFLSDDKLYIVNNPFVHGLSWSNLRELLDPWGRPTRNTANYAPVHLVLHAVQWELVGAETRLYRACNALAHAGVSLLLVPLFLRAGVPAAGAALGAVFFLVHPANVEVVNWIFQLKTLVALGLSLAALMLHERRPATAAGLFALALLTKITALATLPALAVQSWVRAGRGADPRWAWIGGWVAIALVISVLELAAFQTQDDPRILIHADPWVHGRTILAFAARYLWMAATGLGVSTFHEPPTADGWLDPWWLAGLVLLGALGARTIVTLAQRREEAVFWVLAAAGFAPVSQIFPFLYPMGDRYLYPILPGLIGAAWLLLTPVASRATQRLPAAAALGIALAFCGLQLVRSIERAPVFATNEAMVAEAARNYPDGMFAHERRGRAAALRGDVATAARAFDRAVDLGYSDLNVLLLDPELASLRGTPEFRPVLRKVARYAVYRTGGELPDRQPALLQLAVAYDILRQPERAMAALLRARATPGPFGPKVEQMIETLASKYGMPRPEPPAEPAAPR